MSNLTKILLGCLILGLVAVGAILVFEPSLGLPRGILLPILLLCPLIHLYMMRGMHGAHSNHHGPSDESSSGANDGSSVTNNPRTNSCH